VVANAGATTATKALIERGQAINTRIGHAQQKIATPGKQLNGTKLLQAVSSQLHHHTVNAGSLAHEAKEYYEGITRPLVNAVAAKDKEQLQSLIEGIKRSVLGQTTYRKLSQSPGGFVFEGAKACKNLKQLLDAAMASSDIDPESIKSIYTAHEEARHELSNLKV
jgi:hypothetical protein